MNHGLHGLILITLCACAINAQTQSGCRPSPPMSPNAKPGIGGFGSLTPNGKTLLVATGDGKIRFVDLDTGETTRILTFSLSGHKFDVNGLVFTRDDRFLLTGSVDRTIKFWDMSNGRETRSITLN